MDEETIAGRDAKRERETPRVVVCVRGEEKVIRNGNCRANEQLWGGTSQRG